MNKHDIKAVAREFLSIALKAQKNLSLKRDMNKIFFSINDFYSIVGLFQLWAYWDLAQKDLTNAIKFADIDFQTRKATLVKLERVIGELKKEFLVMNTEIREQAEASVSLFLLVLAINRLNSLDESMANSDLMYLDFQTQQHIEYFCIIVSKTEESLARIIPLVDILDSLWKEMATGEDDPYEESILITCSELLVPFGFTPALN